MLKMFKLIGLIAAVFAGIAVAQPLPGVIDLMKATVIPDSDVVFGVAKAAPANDAQWATLQKSAANLMAAAQKLETMAPAGDSTAWLKFAREMSAATRKVAATAKARNADAVQDAGDELYETCAGCHQVFLKR